MQNSSSVMTKAKNVLSEQCPREMRCSIIFVHFEFGKRIHLKLPIFLQKNYFAGGAAHQGSLGCLIMANGCCGAPLSQASHHLRIALVTNKGPAFLVAHVIIFRRCRPILDQRFGVLKVAIYRLDSVCDTGFLGLKYLVRTEMTCKMIPNLHYLPFEFDHQEPLLF